MLVKQSLQYGIGRLLPALIYFGLIALYTRLLDPAEYGSYSFVYAAVWALTGIFFQWLISSAARLSESGTDIAAVRWALTIGFIVSALIALALAIPLCLLIERPDLRALGWAAVALLLATGWFEVVTAMLWAELKAGQYAVLGIVRALCSGAFGGAFAWLGWGALGIVIGMTVGILIPSLYATALQLRGFRFRPPHFSALRGVTSYGLPLMMSYTIGNLGGTADRYILTGLKDVATLGQYSAGLELADRTLKSLITPIGAAALPLALHAQKNGEAAAQDQLRKNFRLLAMILIPAVFGLIAVAPELTGIVVGSEFQAVSRAVMPVIAVSILFWSLRANYFDHAFQLARKTGRTMTVFGVAAGANVALCIPFVLFWGVMGAAYAALLAQVAGLIVCILIGRRVYPMPIPLADLAKILAAGIGMWGGLAALPGEPGPVMLAVKIVAGGAMYGLALLALDLGGIRGLLWERLPAGWVKHRLIRAR